MDHETTSATAIIATDTGITCPKCGYNLSGLMQDRCPECGLIGAAGPERRAAALRKIRRTKLQCMGFGFCLTTAVAVLDVLTPLRGLADLFVVACVVVTTLFWVSADAAEHQAPSPRGAIRILLFLAAPIGLFAYLISQKRAASAGLLGLFFLAIFVWYAIVFSITVRLYTGVWPPLL